MPLRGRGCANAPAVFRVSFEPDRTRTMPLTALQRSVLERYRSFRESPPTLWRLMALSSRNLAILFIVVSVGSIFLYLEASESASWLIAGFGVGAFLRDFGSFRTGVRIWPVIARVLDWQKIDDLLAGREVVDSPDRTEGQQ